MKKNILLFIAVFSIMSFSTIQSFAWTTPVMVSPASGSSVWAGLTVDWNAVSGSLAYQLQVDTTSAFNSPVRLNVNKAYINSNSGNSDTEQFLDNLYFGKKYYWRVRAYVTGDTSAWSATWNFTTRDYVTLSSPASGSSGWAGVTFDWLPHAGVDYYDFEADTTSAFNSPAKKIATNTYINSTDGN
jgi:hypothetical protein